MIQNILKASDNQKNNHNFKLIHHQQSLAYI